MAAEGMEFPRRWTGGTISTNLDVSWEMSVQATGWFLLTARFCQSEREVRPVSEAAVERRPTTILAADAIGYDRLAGEDEAGAVSETNGVRDNGTMT